LLKIIRFESKLTIKFPNSISVTIKREDLIHPSGNKFRKLKYNLLQEKRIREHYTFGGAYSNHIAAVAFAGKEKGFKTIELLEEMN
jgi:1-aminocyclopropane-1-carboxylate deaminase